MRVVLRGDPLPPTAVTAVYTYTSPAILLIGAPKVAVLLAHLS